MTGTTKTVHVIVSGRVQGVWYRSWTEETAVKLGLVGWVRNLRNGSVEAVFSGPVDDVDRMLSALRDGPPLARVEQVTVEPGPDGTFTAFSVRATG